MTERNEEKEEESVRERKREEQGGYKTDKKTG